MPAKATATLSPLQAQELSNWLSTSGPVMVEVEWVDWILSFKRQLNVPERKALKALRLYPDRPMPLSSLAGAMGLAYSEASKVMDLLTATGLVSSNYQGFTLTEDGLIHAGL